MEIKIDKLPKSKMKFFIKMDSDEVTNFFNMASEKIAKEIKVSGFRPGKVPADLAKTMVDETDIEGEAQDLAINDSYYQMVTKEKVVPISRPENIKINFFNKADGLEWEGEVDLLPEVDASNWKSVIKEKGTKIKKEEVVVDEEEVEKTISNLQKQFAKLEEKDGIIVNGDWANIDFDIAEREKSRFDEELLKKFKSNGFPFIVGEANFIPGFEENLLGLKKDDQKEFEVTFPENYHEKKLAKEKVFFNIKVNAVRVVVLPEVDDEFASKFGFEKPEELRTAIRDDIKKQKEEGSKGKFEDSLLRVIADEVKMDVPDTLIEQEKDLIMRRFVHDLEHHNGVKFIDYLASLGKTEKDFRDGFGEHAIYNVKTGLMIGKIAQDEGIDVDDKDIEEAMSYDIIAQTAGLPPERINEFEEKIKEKYKDEEFLDSIKNSIVARKVIDSIVNLAQEK